MPTHDNPDAQFELPEELQRLELQLAKLSPWQSSDWQAQVMFHAGLKRGRVESRIANRKMTLAVAGLVAGVSAWATTQWQPSLSSATVRQIANVSVVSNTSGETLDNSAAPVVPRWSEPESIARFVAFDRQLDDLLARHLPVKVLLDRSVSPASSISEPNTLPTLFDYRNQLLESL